MPRNFDESKHPRRARGTVHGGEFKSAGDTDGNVTHEIPRDAITGSTSIVYGPYRTVGAGKGMALHPMGTTYDELTAAWNAASAYAKTHGLKVENAWDARDTRPEVRQVETARKYYVVK